MSLRERTRPGLGLIEPCLPSSAKAPPPAQAGCTKSSMTASVLWRGAALPVCSSLPGTGNDFTHRFPFIEMTVKSLPVRTCLIDGEAIVCDETGLAVFELIRGHRTVASAVHCAFDLLELDGQDMRREPIEE